MCGHPFAPIQILTGDTRKPCGFRYDRLHDERRSFLRKPCIERRFESSPESRGSQTSGVLLVLFVQAKRINPFPLQGASRFRNPRISPPEQQLRTNKIKSFPKKESRFCKPRFSSPQWRLPTNKIKTFPKGESRFCKPRFSSPQWRLRTNKIKTFSKGASRFCKPRISSPKQQIRTNHPKSLFACFFDKKQAGRTLYLCVRPLC